MNPELNILPKRDWLKPNTTREPMLWVREVRLLYRLEAGVEAEIRRVLLHRGVNIIWARPADPDEANPAARGRGHDVGKTSFCRLLRYLLGEEHYGNEELRLAIAAKESLNRAWVLGEVILDGEPWAVARPLYTGAHHFAIKGVTLDQLIVAPAKDRRTHEDFVKVIDSRVVGNFAVQTFDDGGQKPIRWLHILQWLARDQESHLAGLFKWRDVSSDHGSPELSANEAQFLARCILGVTDVEERRQIERRNALMRDKGTQTDNARYFERRITDALQRARAELPNGDSLPAVGEALFVDVVVRHAKLLVAEKRAKLAAQLATLKLDDLESTLEAAIGATALAKAQYDELSPLVEETEDALGRFTENEQPTQQDVDALDVIIAKLKPDRAFCEIPVNIALFQCPLLQEKRLSEETPAATGGNVPKLAEQKRKHVAKQLAGLKRNLQQFSQQFDACRGKEAVARRQRNEMSERRATLREEIVTLDQEAASWRVRAEDTVFSHRRLDEARTTLKDVEEQLELSKAKQDEAQKSVRARQLELVEVFMAVCHFFKGERADAELKFTRDEINARIGSGGGAYNALSSLAFDYCALIAGLNGIGHHPGLVIHDSPRESDMELSLYRPLFQLAKLLEDRAAASFQYIITTTEEPPTGMTTPPHLCLELDATKPYGKLFKEEL
ncbi:MAG: Uncharacterized protein FD161_1845 [Limisphaerales bacterium]|nr:MAG: Uncharacterized protein FD161_1845 [Limisphaerales bacterium]TXT49060.1 MAG: Uncharacterized protein FD140_3311 [Limisphaerales bacterium]